ncbi:hypothetical protein UFOVP71_437 [uncultured Caudovirales phage]|uniref:Uncharacterized protein n=1 Tax=uncultured Caudovirales phage TaxID=2100421 RepID=A0A6J5TC65_9CAUD|nr:hypothetical protein UFOVP71_437 [uncultured Caudovirales phage]
MPGCLPVDINELVMIKMRCFNVGYAMPGAVYPIQAECPSKEDKNVFHTYTY